jgi:hypothetical protein
MAGPDAHSRWASALRADSRVRRPVKDSNSAWEQLVSQARQDAPVRLRQVSLYLATQKSRGAALPAPARLVLQPLDRLLSRAMQVSVPAEAPQRDAPQASPLRLGLALESPLQAPRAQRQQASKSLAEEQTAPEAWLPAQHSLVARQGGSAVRQQRGQTAEQLRREGPEALPRRASSAPLGPPRPSRPYRRSPFVRLRLPRWRAPGNAHALLPRPLLRSNWNAFSSR